MGCVESHLDADRQPNTFPVISLNEHGQRQHRALRLQVTDSYLVLHQRGRPPTQWPLRCLRRYGYDSDQFSFESGRRCPTGPGIYSFRCRTAEALFNTLQAQIQNIAEEAASRELATMPPNPETRELVRTGSTVSTATDPHNYLEPFPRTHRMSRSSARSGVTSPSIGPANGGIGMTFSNAPSSSGLRSPASQGTVVSLPISPPIVSRHFSVGENIHDSGRIPLVPPPGAFGDPHREPPSPTTPTDSNLSFAQHLRRSGSFTNPAERPSSYSSSGSERPLFPNHIPMPLEPRPHSTPLDVIASEKDSPQPVYMNIKTQPSKIPDMGQNPGRVADPSSIKCEFKAGDTKRGTELTVDPSCGKDVDHIYANLVPVTQHSIVPPIPPRKSTALPTSSLGNPSYCQFSSIPSSTQAAMKVTPPHGAEMVPGGRIKYITVDLENRPSTAEAPRSSTSSIRSGPLRHRGSTASVDQRDIPKGPEGGKKFGYATIDFEKTEALSTTAKAVWENRMEEEGIRRTRQNSSTFVGPPTTTQSRHGSSVSFSLTTAYASLAQSIRHNSNLSDPPT